MRCSGAELALYWRVICEALSDDASALGGGAALGGCAHARDHACPARAPRSS
jgi:hypothetical protein